MNLRDLIEADAAKYGVRADLIAGVVHRESGGNPLAVGDGGLALGLMQIHPGAAKDIGLDWPALQDAIKAGDAEKAAELGIEAVAYLALMLKEANQDSRLALAAYNQGPSIIRNQTSEAAKKGFAYADSILKETNVDSQTEDKIYQLVHRFSEPSSYAGLSALFALLGVAIPGALIQAITLTLSGVCGVVAFFMPEQK